MRNGPLVSILLTLGAGCSYRGPRILAGPDQTVFLDLSYEQGTAPYPAGEQVQYTPGSPWSEGWALDESYIPPRLVSLRGEELPAEHPIAVGRREVCRYVHPRDHQGSLRFDAAPETWTVLVRDPPGGSSLTPWCWVHIPVDISVTPGERSWVVSAKPAAGAAQTSTLVVGEQAVVWQAERSMPWERFWAEVVEGAPSLADADAGDRDLLREQLSDGQGQVVLYARVVARLVGPVSLAPQDARKLVVEAQRALAQGRPVDAGKRLDVLDDWFPGDDLLTAMRAEAAEQRDVSRALLSGKVFAPDGGFHWPGGEVSVGLRSIGDPPEVFRYAGRADSGGRFEVVAAPGTYELVIFAPGRPDHVEVIMLSGEEVMDVHLRDPAPP